MIDWNSLGGTALAMAPTGQGGGFMEMAFPFILMIGIMYLLVIRPQKKQADQHKAFLAKLAKGDDVITGGGLLGKVYGVADNVVTLEIANNVRIKVLKGSVHPYKGADGKVASIPQNNNDSTAVGS